MTDRHGGNVYIYDREMLDFSASLNPLGMPREVREAAERAVRRSDIYPDPDCRKLTAAAEAASGIPGELFAFGNGATDIIYRLALLVRPRTALIAGPAFSEYERALAGAGCRLSRCSAGEEDGFRTDTAALGRVISEERPEAVFIASPANPAGTTVSAEELYELADICRISGSLLVIDRCFAHFLLSDKERAPLVGVVNRPGLVVLDSLTKVLAMAGLRLGYAICGSQRLAEALRDALQPWAVSTVAQEAGRAGFAILGEQASAAARHTAAEREFLSGGLRRLGLKVYASDVNYMMFRGPAPLAAALRDRGILIRVCADQPELGRDFFRIAVRRHEENRRLIEALSEVIGR